MEGLDIRPEQKVYLNWFLWCEAVLKELDWAHEFFFRTILRKKYFITVLKSVYILS